MVCVHRVAERSHTIQTKGSKVKWNNRNQCWMVDFFAFLFFSMNQNPCVANEFENCLFEMNRGPEKRKSRKLFPFVIVEFRNTY